MDMSDEAIAALKLFIIFFFFSEHNGFPSGPGFWDVTLVQVKDVCEVKTSLPPKNLTLIL